MTASTVYQMTVYQKRLDLLGRTHPGLNRNWFRPHVSNRHCIAIDSAFYSNRNFDDMCMITTKRPYSDQERYHFEFGMKSETLYPWGYRTDFLSNLISTGWPIIPGLDIHFNRSGRLVGSDEDRIIAITDWEFPGGWFNLDWTRLQADLHRVNYENVENPT